MDSESGAAAAMSEEQFMPFAGSRPGRVGGGVAGDSGPPAPDATPHRTPASSPSAAAESDPGGSGDARRLETVGRLTAGVAHDFNNILSVILASASELEGELAEGEHRERAVEIRAAAERGARLTRQLLTYSRPERGGPQPVDVNLAALDSMRLLSRTIGEDVSLRSDPAAGLPKVLLAPGQAEQVIVNLVTNARDALPEGGTITIRTRLVPIGPEDLRLGTGWHVCLSVRDDGTGMPEAVAEQALEPFFTTKESSRGTGLGLATVAEIAGSAGGDVRITSRPGEGTGVSVFIPAVRGDGQPLALSARPDDEHR